MTLQYPYSYSIIMNETYHKVNALTDLALKPHKKLSINIIASHNLKYGIIKK